MSDNYISKVRIRGLFGDGATHEMYFSEGVNCIYGVNGSGKTTIINLITACLSCNLELLKEIPFSEITIFTTKSGNKRPLVLMSVLKKDLSDQDDEFLKWMQSKKSKTVIKGYSRALQRRDAESLLVFKVGDQEYSYSDFFGKDNGKELAFLLREIEGSIRLTHLPLTRMHAADAFNFSNESNEFFINWRNRGASKKDISRLLDTSTQVLLKLEDEFISLYGRKQDEINKELEILKQKILNKLLIEKEQLHVSTRDVLDKAVKYQYDLKGILSQLHDADIFPEKNRVIEHFEVWERAIRELEESKAAFNKSSESEVFDLNVMERYMDAHSRALSFSNAFDRFFSVIDDVKEMQHKKEKRMSVFNKFKDVVNDFLNNKVFSYSEDMRFLVTSSRIMPRNDKCNINLSDLSSGEKHIIAILGRVALQEEKSSVFIADEPELSLHLEWQRKILPAVRKISPALQVIVATHSPAIIPNDATMIDIEECVTYD